jgi:glucose-1-phosphate thymidylyltransferase
MAGSLLRKGIVLAGGQGTRLRPITNAVCKQLIPVYDKPLIYYPISTLVDASIREILIIGNPDDLSIYGSLFGDGSQLGLKIDYMPQEKPRGISDAFIIGEDFLDNSPAALALGDNIFYGSDFYKDLNFISKQNTSCVFGYRVSNPSDYGVVNFSRVGSPEDCKIVVEGIEEKPDNPKSNYAVPGLYFYDQDVTKYAKRLDPSDRGELEITDLNNLYIKEKKLQVKLLRDSVAWFDTGSFSALFEASMFVKSIQSRTGLMVGCIEEVSYKKGFMSLDQLIAAGTRYKQTPYGQYILNKYEK